MARYGNERAVGGRQRCWPRRRWRKAVRAVDDGDIMPQCCSGVLLDGRVKLQFGKSGGLVSESWSCATSLRGDEDSDFGC